MTTPPTHSPVALVTGASHGFGKLIANTLAQANYTVFGTSRNPDDTTMGNVHMLRLELTDPASIQACVQGVLQRAGRIDVLVNNAGRFHEGLIEEAPLSEVEHLFQTNFFGPAHVNNAVLPVMRQQRRGHIIMIGSLAGLVGVSGLGYTSAVKHALEGYSEALYAEVKAFGIHVSIVEPSFFRTEIYDRRITSARTTMPDYDAIRTRLEAALLKDHANSADPQAVADLVARVAQSYRPRLRYPIGPGAQLFWRLKRYMPEAFFLPGLASRVTS